MKKLRKLAVHTMFLSKEFRTAKRENYRILLSMCGHVCGPSASKIISSATYRKSDLLVIFSRLPTAELPSNFLLYASICVVLLLVLMHARYRQPVFTWLERYRINFENV